MKIKILYITSTLKRSGPTNQLYNLLKFIDKNLFELYVITLSPEPNDSRWSDFCDIGIEVSTLNLSRIKWFSHSLRHIERHTLSISPDIIHSQGIRADIIVSKMKNTIPKICTIHNFPQFDYNFRYGRLLGWLMTLYHTNALNNINLKIGVSESVSNNLISEFNLKNVNTIPNGVDTEIYHSVCDNEKKTLRNKLHIPQNSNIWLFCGHLTDLKDPCKVFNGFVDIFGNDRKNNLIFLGSGTLEDKLKEKAIPFNNVFVMGRVKNVFEYLQSSDFFISTSKTEGLPMAVIEALACGLPVLLSDIDPHKEIINMNTSIGATYKLGDYNEFKKRLKSMDSGDYSKMQTAAISLSNSKLSAKNMVNKYQSVYSNLVKSI